MELIDNLSVLPVEQFLADGMNWDVFISCGSFETRCTRSSELFRDSLVQLTTSIIFDYKEKDPEGKGEENLQIMRSQLTEICNSVNVFDSESVSRPSEGIKKFLGFLSQGNINLSNKDVIVDITVFTKPYFFLLFKVMIEKFSIRRFHVVYTEPERYKSKNTNNDEIILTEGLDRIESIPGFAGSSLKLKDALIVVMGFEGKRSNEVFSIVNPERAYAINGFPSFQPGWHTISMEANLRFLEESGAHSNVFLASAADPFDVRKVVSQIIQDIRQNYSDLNVVIAPLGTKMQAFGVLLSALHDNKIKVIYPFPSTYKTDYSFKYGPTLIFAVDLDGLAVEA